MSESINSADFIESMTNHTKRSKAVKASNEIVDILSRFIPETCRYEAVRHLEIALLERNMEFMDERTKALLKSYEGAILKAGCLEVKATIIKDEP